MVISFSFIMHRAATCRQHQLCSRAGFLALRLRGTVDVERTDGDALYRSHTKEYYAPG
jgi:hypothetical protein